MMNKNTQRIVVAILAVILAVIMVLSLVAPAFAADQVIVGDAQTEAASEEPVEDGETAAAQPDGELMGEAMPSEAETVSAAPQNGGETEDSAAADVASEENNDISEAGKASEFSLIASESKVIPGGVKIGAVDVSGMNREQAEAAVNEHVTEMQNSVLTTTAEGQEMYIAVSDLGFKWTNPNVVNKALGLGCKGNILERYKVKKDLAANGIELPIEREFNTDAMHAFISQCAATANRDPVENDLQMNPDGTLSVVEGSNGLLVDEGASFSAMVLYMNTGWRGGAPSFALTTTSLPPQRDKEQLARVKDIIGTGDTDYSGSSDARVQNIVNGTNMVSGMVLMPGEQFSLLAHVVPFSAENGYAPAPSYAEGQIVDTYGGGICQVSTTIYLAVLQAELQVDERSCHSMMVQYIEPSKDAAISEEGGKDLKFTNNTDAPIFLYGTASGDKLHFSIYGVETRPAGRTVNYISNVLSQTDVQFIFVADENLPVGTVSQSGDPHIGYEAELWKEITENGETTREWVNESSYRMTPITYTIGVQTPDPALKASLMGAIAAEQLDQVNAVLIGAGYSVG